MTRPCDLRGRLVLLLLIATASWVGGSASAIGVQVDPRLMEPAVTTSIHGLLLAASDRPVLFADAKLGADQLAVWATAPIPRAVTPVSVFGSVGTSPSARRAGSASQGVFGRGPPSFAES